MEALIGQDPRPAMIDTISAVRHVTKETSPSFLYSTVLCDETVNSMNATAYYDALKRAGVPAELHTSSSLAARHRNGTRTWKGMAELQIWPTLLEHQMQLHG